MDLPTVFVNVLKSLRARTVESVEGQSWRPAAHHMHQRRALKLWRSVAVAALWCLSWEGSGVDAFTVDIEPGEQQCFVVVAGQGDELFGNFEVLTEADYKPVEVKVTGPDGKTTFEAAGKAEQIFSFTADKAGDYRLCISNGARGDDADDGVARTVGFSFRSDILVDLNIANEESIRRLIELGNQLTKGFANILDHQSYMRQREDLHASTMESTSSRVLVWTIAEAAVLIGVAVWQIMYISRFFETKRMI